MATMQVLSVQSVVAYGHVGSSAATFPLQRLGHEVWPVPTVVFSNHTGYPAWRGPALGAAVVADLIEGMSDVGALAGIDAVLSGYLGDPGIGAVVLDAVARVRAVNPAAVFCCDPVMGDVGRGMFVRPGIPEHIRDDLVPAADILTPNHFELEFLAGRPAETLAAVLEAVATVRAAGPGVVLVTSVVVPDLDPGSLGMLAVSPDGAWLVTTPRLPIAPNGCGDLTAALFLAHLASTGSAAVALGWTAASVHSVLEHTLAAGTREIALVAAQEAIAHPDERFAVVPLPV